MVASPRNEALLHPSQVRSELQISNGRVIRIDVAVKIGVALGMRSAGSAKILLANPRIVLVNDAIAVEIGEDQVLVIAT